jgi:hypothetical protein
MDARASCTIAELTWLDRRCGCSSRAQEGEAKRVLGGGLGKTDLDLKRNLLSNTMRGNSDLAPLVYNALDARALCTFNLNQYPSPSLPKLSVRPSPSSPSSALAPPAQSSAPRHQRYLSLFYEPY